MIEPGEWRQAKYWGWYHINKVVELPEPVVFDTPQWGQTRFRPTIAEIQWENGNKEFWFPYWIGPVGKERFGQYAPMLSEKQLLALLREAIDQEFFSREFLSQLGERLWSGEEGDRASAERQGGEAHDSMPA